MEGPQGPERHHMSRKMISAPKAADLILAIVPPGDKPTPVTRATLADAMDKIAQTLNAQANDLNSDLTGEQAWDAGNRARFAHALAVALRK